MNALERAKANRDWAMSLTDRDDHWKEGYLDGLEWVIGMMEELEKVAQAKRDAQEAAMNHKNCEVCE